MESLTLTIDGHQITVEKGKTVLRAAIEHGISIPYYCYHPGIGIDGSCRVCVVKIEIDRGYGSEIATFQEEGVHSLMSGNLVDVCPVGAITTRDYRFKSRPWDNPNAADTVCTQCEKGCNITVWLKARPECAKGARLVRVTPRFNPDVNNYWMCDIGRFGYPGSRETIASAGRSSGTLVALSALSALSA